MVASTPLVTINQETNVVEAAKLMRQKHIRHLPVNSGDRLVGMLSHVDLVFSPRQSATATSIHQDTQKREL